MSDESHAVAGSGDDKGNITRVGTAEREAAVAQLGEHWRAGRLDPAEHELRVTRARAAVTRADLDALFIDLPPATAAPVPASDEVAGQPQGWRDSRETIMALAPFAALVLFFITLPRFSYAWLWFLLVPVLGILLYGPGGRRNPRRRGH